MRYWEYKGLDARDPQSSRHIRFSFPNNNYSQALLSKTYLTQFWMGTQTLDRLRIVGSLGSIIDTALRDSEVTENSENNSANNSARKGSDAAKVTVFPHQDIKLLSALVDFSMEKRAIEFLFKDKKEVDERTFIEILYFSPLKTAGIFLKLYFKFLKI